MLGMLMSGMTVYGRTTSPVDLFARITEGDRGRRHDRDTGRRDRVPAGSPRYKAPLLRIRLPQVDGWWLVPTDAEGKAS
jgi:hypothetical protein